LIRKFFRRLAAALFGCALVLAGLAAWVYVHLPDTFLVPQGQQLAIAQMPWIAPLHRMGSSEAGAQEVGSSRNVTLSLWGVVPVKTVRAVVVDRRAVAVCGTPFGIKMFSDGAMVVGFTDIRTAAGYCNPAKEAGLKLGDLLVSIGGQPAQNNEQVAAALQQSAGAPVEVVFLREGVRHTASIIPVADAAGEGYKTGMWVRDSSAGIGTLTFVDNATGVYAGLGHSISDVDTGERIALRSGEIVPVSITGYVVGAVGSPGELKGAFTTDIAMGDIRINGPTGVYGRIRTLAPGPGQDRTVAQAQEVREGPATILTTIAGGAAREYSVEIERVSLAEEDPNRNMVVRVTDEALLSATGGIVQGMSGSPILQDGRLVGAVTHVLVNDPTRGFGIFAQTMLETADGVARQQDEAA